MSYNPPKDASLKEKEAATADQLRLLGIKAARAEKATIAKQKAVDELAKQLASLSVSEFPAVAAKCEKAVGTDGVVTAVFQACLDKAGGMPTPEGKAIVKALKEALPVLAKIVDAEEKQMALLAGCQSWLLGQPGRIEAAGKGTTNMLVLLHNNDLVEEDVAITWWAEVQSKEAAAATAAAAAKEAADEAVAAARSATVKEREAAENLIEVQFQERADKKTAENSKCGQAATAEEEAWEKQANQAHRKAIKTREQATARAAATKKTAQVSLTEEKEGVAASKALTETAKALAKFSKAVVPFATWLMEEDEDSD